MSLIPTEDEDFLEQKKFLYEIKKEGAEIHIILLDWQLPDCYTPQKADILIRILPGYPLTPIDMFWTIPDVKLAGTGGFPKAADQHESYGAKSWQRWSRHTDWRAGIDNLRTFITAMDKEFNQGI